MIEDLILLESGEWLTKCKCKTDIDAVSEEVLQPMLSQNNEKNRLIQLLQRASCYCSPGPPDC